jgi:hypothetical protein
MIHTTISIRELYGLSRRMWWMFVSFRSFTLIMAVLNFAMLIWNLYLGAHRSAIISATFTLACVAVLVHQQRMIARHRRDALAHARKQLEECYRFGICPDCGQLSLDKKSLTCDRSMACGSRFARDPVSQEWTRL